MRSDVRENFSQSVSRHRPDRRRAHRLGAAAAVRGVPHRRRHQQHPLEQRAGDRRPPRAWPGWCRSRSAIRTAAFRCWRTTSSLLRPLPLRRPAAAGAGAGPAPSTACYDAVLGAEVAQRLALPPRPAHRAQPRRRRARRATSTPTSRSPWSASWRAPARRWTAPCTSSLAGDGGDPPRLGGRRAAAGHERLGRGGVAARPDTQARHRRAGGAEARARRCSRCSAASTTTAANRCWRSCPAWRSTSCGTWWASASAACWR